METEYRSGTWHGARPEEVKAGMEARVGTEGLRGHHPTRPGTALPESVDQRNL